MHTTIANAINKRLINRNFQSKLENRDIDEDVHKGARKL